jgi:hypothetical protein
MNEVVPVLAHVRRHRRRPLAFYLIVETLDDSHSQGDADIQLGTFIDRALSHWIG